VESITQNIGQHFLILNGLVVTLVVLSFIVMRRAPKGPVKLELRDEIEVASDQAREAKAVAEKPKPKFRDPRLGWKDYQPRLKRPRVEVLEPEDSGRSLNAFFNWNGHTWDAYEVLGIPGGSSVESARIAHDRAAALADAETLPFLKAALTIITNS
jgi:hypothetical protein